MNMKEHEQELKDLEKRLLKKLGEVRADLAEVRSDSNLINSRLNEAWARTAGARIRRAAAAAGMWALATLVLIALGAACNGCQEPGPGLSPCERDLLFAHTACMGKGQVFTDGSGLFAVCSEHTPDAWWMEKIEIEIRERGMEALVDEHRAYRMGAECTCMDAYNGEAGPVHACSIDDPAGVTPDSISGAPEGVR